MKKIIHFRTLAVNQMENAQILDIIELCRGSDVRIYFSRITRLEEAKRALQGLGISEPLKTSSINGAVNFNTSGHLEVPKDWVSKAEPSLLKNRNTCIATHNRESVNSIVDWLCYHYDNFGMNGAVFIERAMPRQQTSLWVEVESKLAASERDIRIVVLESSIPLGHNNATAES